MSTQNSECQDTLLKSIDALEKEKKKSFGQLKQKEQVIPKGEKRSRNNSFSRWQPDCGSEMPSAKRKMGDWSSVSSNSISAWIRPSRPQITMRNSGQNIKSNYQKALESDQKQAVKGCHHLDEGRAAEWPRSSPLREGPAACFPGGLALRSWWCHRREAPEAGLGVLVAGKWGKSPTEEGAAHGGPHRL